MGVKLSQAGPIGLFTPVGLSTSVSHLLCPIVLAVYGDAYRVSLWGCPVWCCQANSTVSFREVDGYVGTDDLFTRCFGVLNLWLKYSYRSLIMETFLCQWPTERTNDHKDWRPVLVNAALKNSKTISNSIIWTLLSRIVSEYGGVHLQMGSIN